MKTAGDRPPELRPESKYGLRYRDDLPIDPTGEDYSGHMVCGKCGWIHHKGPHYDTESFLKLITDFQSQEQSHLIDIELC